MSFCVCWSSLPFYKRKSARSVCKRYLQKRLKIMHRSDLGTSLFYEDMFYWDGFLNRDGDSLGRFFRLRRVKKLIERHASLLLKWIDFVDKHWSVVCCASRLFFSFASIALHLHRSFYFLGMLLFFPSFSFSHLPRLSFFFFLSFSPVLPFYVNYSLFSFHMHESGISLNE